MKLCYVNINTEEASKPFLSIVGRLFRQVANPDTEIDIKSVNPGLERITDVHPYFFFLNKRQIVERILEAERQGYDAAIVGCFLDPGVSEARGIVNMPVIGLGESAMHFACLLGRRFGIVTANEPPVISEIEDEIRFHGLQDRVIARPVRGISMPSREVFTRGLQNPRIVSEDVLQKAKECVEEGANVVIVGCNGLAPLCTAAGVARVGEDDIPLIDCVSVGVETAEMIVDLNKKLGMPFISRTGFYALPRRKDLSRIRATFGLRSFGE